jgi:hypothetical protein
LLQPLQRSSPLSRRCHHQFSSTVHRVLSTSANAFRHPRHPNLPMPAHSASGAGSWQPPASLPNPAILGVFRYRKIQR